MKILLLLVIGLLAAPTISRAVDQASFVIAIRNESTPRTNDPGWSIETGEVYQFVRFMSSLEYSGSKLPSEDKTFCVLRVAEVIVIAQTANFRLIEEKDIVAATARYNQQIAQMRTYRAAAAVAAQQRSNESQQEQVESQRQPTQSVRPNAYGLGVNSDEYGRPQKYRTQDGEEVSPIFQDGVKRDAYGLGVHSDQFGRPVYDGKP